MPNITAWYVFYGNDVHLSCRNHSCATFNEATVNLVSLVNAGTTSTPAQGEYWLIIISVNEQNQAEQPEKRAVQTTFKHFFSSL